MKMQSLLRRVLVGPALCALFMASPLSHGAILIGTGYANGHEAFTLTGAGTVNAGGFMGTLDGTPLLFWCAELTQTFGFFDPQPYNVIPLNNPTLSGLFDEVGGSTAAIATTRSSAAFQLAIWEILFEGTTTTPYSLSTGSFQATGADTLAIDMANAWLLALAGPGNTVLAMLTNRDHQDFLTDQTPPGLLVPEPASLPLVGVGILAVMIALRRRTHRVSR